LGVVKTNSIKKTNFKAKKNKKSGGKKAKSPWGVKGESHETVFWSAKFRENNLKRKEGKITADLPTRGTSGQRNGRQKRVKNTDGNDGKGQLVLFSDWQNPGTKKENQGLRPKNRGEKNWASKKQLDTV